MSTRSLAQDFRSPEGTFNHQEFRPAEGISSAKDLFHARCLRHPEQRHSQFLYFAEMREKANSVRVPPVHVFIAMLKEQGKLCRVYSQNIDGFESRANLTVWTRGDDNAPTDPDVVLLHGSLHYSCCERCNHSFPVIDEDLSLYRRGKYAECPDCAYAGERLGYANALHFH